MREPDHQAGELGCLLLLTFLGQARKVRSKPGDTGDLDLCLRFRTKGHYPNLREVSPGAQLT